MAVWPIENRSTKQKKNRQKHVKWKEFARIAYKMNEAAKEVNDGVVKVRISEHFLDSKLPNHMQIFVM